MKHTSCIELNQTALNNNITFIKSLLNTSEFISVIKGNAYGHNISSFAPMLNKSGMEKFAVYSVDEAEQVLNSNVKMTQLLIMGCVDGDNVKWAIENNVSFFVFDKERLFTAIKFAKQLNIKAKIHIEIETGMNRTGFDENEFTTLCDIILANKDCLIVEGLCSHLAGAEDISNYYRIENQISVFKKTINLFSQKKINPSQVHLASSAAIINYPETIFDVARVGILQYGFWPSKEVKMAYMVKYKNQKDPLQRVLSWKSMVMSIKNVEAGEYIGYGNSVLAEKQTKVATVPVGYAHGFSRSLSNQGKVLINESRVDVIGMVNMNLILIDVTNLPNVAKGDEVVLIGNQGDLSITVSSFGDLSVQLNYELLTRLPNDIPRFITK